jgi:hypothetical protein
MNKDRICHVRRLCSARVVALGGGPNPGVSDWCVESVAPRVERVGKTRCNNSAG